MFISHIYILITAAVIFSIAASILNPHKITTFFYPIKFYILFLFIAVTYLAFSAYGTRLEWLPFATKEGMSAFVKQSLRLWCWLQTVHIFKRFRFHEMFIGILYRFFPSRTGTLKAGMVALEHFPEIVRLAKSEKKIPIQQLLFNPKKALTGYMGAMADRITGAVCADYNSVGAATTIKPPLKPQ
jgi:hypothetical protein